MRSAAVALAILASLSAPRAASAQEIAGPGDEPPSAGGRIEQRGNDAAQTSGPESEEAGAALDAPDGRREDVPLELEQAALLDMRLGEARSGRVERVHAWASLGFFAGRISPTIISSSATLRGVDAVVLAPSFGLRLALGEELDASFDWNLAYGSATVNGEYQAEIEPERFESHRERVEAGNPTIQVAWSHAWSSLVLSVGVGAAFPVAALSQAPNDMSTAADRAASAFVHEAMLAMNAATDPWRYLPERLSFFVPVRIAMGDRLGGAVELAGGWLIPVLGSPGGTGSEAALQVAGDVVYEIVPAVRVGVRGSLVAWRLGANGTSARVQTALEPWARLVVGAGFVGVRATLDLGGDYGLGGPAGIWAIHVGGGASLERAP